MTTTEIASELQRLPTVERLKVVEQVMQQLQKEFAKANYAPSERAGLNHAAEVLLEDYTRDPELTAFTALDGDSFHA